MHVINWNAVLHAHEHARHFDPALIAARCPWLKIMKDRGFVEVPRSPVRVAEPAAVEANISAITVRPWLQQNFPSLLLRARC